MSKLLMFSIFDTVARAFIAPFFCPNRQVAQRAFTESVNDKTHAFARSPYDYQLYFLGEFDSESGLVEPAELIFNMGTAAAYIIPVTTGSEAANV